MGQEGNLSCAMLQDSESSTVYKKNWQADQ